MLKDQTTDDVADAWIDGLDNCLLSLGIGMPVATLPVDFLTLFESRTTISLLEWELRSQIGKCLWAASSENIREQCGHCLRLSNCFCIFELTVLCVKLYWFALSVLDLPTALLIYSLSYFHLGTLWPLIGLESVLSYLLCLRGGLADATLGFLKFCF